MYLFSRQVTLRGSFQEMMAWATEITELVNDIGKVPVTLWSSSMGNPIGSLAWSSRIESHAQLGEQMAALQSDQRFLDLSDKAQQWVHEPGEDLLRQFLTEPADEVPQVAVITTAAAANGREADAMEFGVDMAQHLSKLTGRPLAFLQDAYGTYGQVTWIAGYADMAEVDAANEAMQADEGFLNRLTKAGELFLPGSGQRALATRLI
ncbi:MAG: hypothetical protein OES57_10710 [Acidimicrobiia bacterium]|nr:hypothetical protein [Acidimicrobiia bacterium]